jgi:hypothetical protein
MTRVLSYFRYIVKKRAPHIGEAQSLKERDGVYFLFIHERAQLLQLLCRDPLGEEAHDILNSIFKRFQNVERVADEIELAFRYSVRVEDCRPRIKSIGEDKQWALVFYRPGRVIDGVIRSDYGGALGWPFASGPSSRP